MALDLAGVMVSAGAACSSGKVRPRDVLRAMGVPPEIAGAAIRVSLGWSSDGGRYRPLHRRLERHFGQDRRPASSRRDGRTFEWK